MDSVGVQKKKKTYMLVKLIINAKASVSLAKPKKLLCTNVKGPLFLIFICINATRNTRIILFAIIASIACRLSE